MTSERLVLLIVFAPLLGALLLPLAARVSEGSRNRLALGLILVSLFGTLALLPAVMGGEPVAVRLWGLRLFRADRLAVFMSLVSSLVGAIIVLYSFDYIEHYEHRDEYYLMVVLFLGAMMGLVYARNLIVLYVFWEITAIACWRLIGFFREPVCVWRADKAFLVTVFGALTMLIGFLVLGTEAGTFDLPGIRVALAGTPASNLAVCLILVGILSKSATVPLHTWLPDAGVAPSPVTALLHAAVLVKIGVYVYARIFLCTVSVEPFWHTAVPTLAAVSALVSACAALLETDLKRIIAYSTVSQIAFIFLGLAVGNEIGVAGGLLYILMHGISKGGLFLCAGIVEQRTHTKDVTKMGGLLATMPVTAVSFALCAFSVMGIPPLGGFFSKYLVISGALADGQLGVALVFVLGAVLTILYLLRVFTLVFLGEARGESGGHALPQEGSRLMVLSVAVLAALSVASGVFVSFPAAFVRAALTQMVDAGL